MKKVIFKNEEQTVNFRELNNESHVGFKGINSKGHVVYIGGNNFTAISMNSTHTVCNTHYTGGTHRLNLIDVVSDLGNNGMEYFVFDTRKELYQWLAED